MIILNPRKVPYLHKCDILIVPFIEQQQRRPSRLVRLLFSTRCVEDRLTTHSGITINTIALWMDPIFKQRHLVGKGTRLDTTSSSILTTTRYQVHDEEYD